MIPMGATLALILAAIILVAALSAIILAPLISAALDRLQASGAREVMAVFAVLAALMGGAKHMIGHVEFPYTDAEQRYLFDAGSYVTNDFVHVAFTRSALLPLTADFLGFVRPCESTNDADWVCFLESNFAEFSSPSNIPFAGAISNDFQFFTTWTPGPVVHTNGVAVIVWQQVSNGWAKIVPVRTGIYADGKRLAPNPAITNGVPTVKEIKE